MVQKPKPSKTGNDRSAQNGAPNQIYQWGELLLRWAWFIFEVARWMR